MLKPIPTFASVNVNGLIGIGIEGAGIVPSLQKEGDENENLS